MWKRKTHETTETTPEFTQPKFVVKIKQNRYEKFILEELRVSGDTAEELKTELQLGLQGVLAHLAIMNRRADGDSQ